MMDHNLSEAYSFGYEQLSMWSDLIDRINIFPVPDSDTGRNLKISLEPLKKVIVSPDATINTTINQLLLCATGNSGNIAARFFSGMLEARTLQQLNNAVANGSVNAWQSVTEPKPGTMLTVFKRFSQSISETINLDHLSALKIIDDLRQSVLDTIDLLPDLKKAHVVDAGALAMFIFFDGFLRHLFGMWNDSVPITELFAGALSVSPDFKFNQSECYCIDTLIKIDDDLSKGTLDTIREMGESVVVIPQESFIKIHLHAEDGNAVKNQLKSFGNIVAWSCEDMSKQIDNTYKKNKVIHIMTDAAGSITREDSEALGMTLLDSYLVFDTQSIPETTFPPSKLYEAMRKGIRVTTAQASVIERHQSYSNVMAHHEQIVYLCVGSVFTGNYGIAKQWKNNHDPENRLRIVDTAAASGRLGIIALKVAEYARYSDDIDAVVDFAEKLVDKCREFIFLDCLKYLAAGGRLSRTSSFFGDMLNIKPVISPTRLGAEKAGVVRSRKGQVKFALEKLSEYLGEGKTSFILLEYSDNPDWVNDIVLPEIKKRYPLADVKLQPLSLTSGTHMGPGTWGLAFLPE